jgi:tyrosinase
MKFELKINGSESPEAGYVGWTPVKCTLKIVNYQGDDPVSVVITTGQFPGAKGEIALYEDNSTSASSVNVIVRDLKDEEFDFYVAGVFERASVAMQDTFIQVESTTEGIEKIQREVMVRVRKNANELTDEEIKLFLKCFTELSEKDAVGNYQDNGYTVTPTKLLDELVLMHSLDTSAEIHGRTSFHPWHRAFLSHLEREMQKVDPRVTVPYWKFDEAAPNVFTEKFVGKTRASTLPETADYVEMLYDRNYPLFDRANPMFTYKDHTAWGPLRRAYFHNDPAEGKPNPGIHDEATIISYSDNFKEWCDFEEVRSHNRGHTAFTGHVVDVGRDPVDPLFFMMHGNVDRLWALWQSTYDRFDPTDAQTYPFPNEYTGSSGTQWAQENPEKYSTVQNIWTPDQTDKGNFLEDTLWPWDMDNELSRPWRKWSWKTDDPNTTYGEGSVPNIRIWFPETPSATSPGQKPTVRSTIDYQGRKENGVFLGFDYDQIPYFDADQPPVEDRPAINTVEYNATFFNQTLETKERLFAGDRAIMFSDEDQSKTLELVKNTQEDNAIRLKAVEHSNVRLAGFPRIALDVISSVAETVELRLELIQKMLELKRANQRTYANHVPEFFNILRGYLNSEHVRLREEAVRILSANEDPVVQEFLIEQIQSEEAGLFSKIDALSFLRQNSKNQHAQLFKEVFEKEENENIRMEAIAGLANDKESSFLLRNVVLNSNESYKVREVGALALHYQDRKSMNDLAAQIVSEPEMGDGIKLFRSNSPNSDEVDFKATLLNMLVYTGDIIQLERNEELKASLREVIDPATDNKAKFLSSTEAFSEIPSDGPTVLERMAKELLTRIEGNGDQ